MDRTVIDQVAGIAPEVAAGYRELRALIDTDGALSAAHKALLVACGAVARSQPELARRELERGRGLGLGEDDIGTAGVAFLLARGEDACERFATAAGGLRPAAAPRPASELDAPAYFMAFFGVDALPARMARMAERAPALFSAYHRMHHGILAADPVAGRLGELVMVAVNAAELQGGFAAIHAATARRAGVTDDELVEAVLCAMPAAGVAAWAACAEAILG